MQNHGLFFAIAPPRESIGIVNREKAERMARCMQDCMAFLISVMFPVKDTDNTNTP